MTPNEIAQFVFANLNPEDTAEFAAALKDKVMNGHTSENQKIIADQLETVGIIITGIPCKRYPT